MTSRLSALWPAVLASLLVSNLWAEQARAHPHVWITAITTFVFEDRQITGIRHHWTFDEFFSSFVIEEHDADGDGVLNQAEIADIRENAFSNLEEYGYFTHVRVDGERLPAEDLQDFVARIEDGILIYEFALALPEPIDPVEHDVAAGVYDPEYYIELLLDQDDPVRFAGLPSGACIFDIQEDALNPIYFGMVYPLAITLNCATS